jgi:poly(A)-specific ribonuclease
MQVTKQNFNSILEQIKELVPTCEFMSFDEEMTGISISDGKKETVADLPEQRYQKNRDVASRYKIIQFGICLFHRDKEYPNTLFARPYNFYVFPESGAVNMEGSSIHFNKEHGMDFNKWIYDGIPYVSQPVKRRLLEKANETANSSLSSWKQKQQAQGLIKVTRPADVEFVDLTLAAFKQFLQGTEEVFQVSACNSFIRLAIRQQIELLDETAVISTVGESRARLLPMEVRRMSPAQRQAKEEKDRQERVARALDRVGFTQVFDILASSRKPLVGHNCLYDLLFMLSHFLDTLPNSLAEFKTLVSSLFPYIYDTKVLADRFPFNTKPKHTLTPRPAADNQTLTPTSTWRFTQHSLGGLYDTLTSEASNSVLAAAVTAADEKSTADSTGSVVAAEASVDGKVGLGAGAGGVCSGANNTNNNLVGPAVRVELAEGFGKYAQGTLSHENHNLL